MRVTDKSSQEKTTSVIPPEMRDCYEGNMIKYNFVYFYFYNRKFQCSLFILNYVKTQSKCLIRYIMSCKKIKLLLWEELFLFECSQCISDRFLEKLLLNKPWFDSRFCNWIKLFSAWGDINCFEIWNSRTVTLEGRGEGPDL